MTPGIFAKTFNRESAGEALTAARNAGFRTVQFNMACTGLPSMPDQLPASVLEAVREAIRKTPMPVAGLSGTFNMIHPDPAVRRTGLQRLEVLAAACPHLGADLATGTYTATAAVYLEDGSAVTATGSGVLGACGPHEWRLNGFGLVADGTRFAFEGVMALASRSLDGKLHAVD